MTDATLDAALLNTINASGMPDLRVPPRHVARFFSVPHDQARRACRRLARRGALRGGRTLCGEGSK